MFRIPDGPLSPETADALMRKIDELENKLSNSTNVPFTAEAGNHFVGDFIDYSYMNLPFRAQILGSAGLLYSWEEVIQGVYNNWTPKIGGRSGTLASNPAVEANFNTAVTVGTVVQMRRSYFELSSTTDWVYVFDFQQPIITNINTTNITIVNEAPVMPPDGGGLTFVFNTTDNKFWIWNPVTNEWIGFCPCDEMSGSGYRSGSGGGGGVLSDCCIGYTVPNTLVVTFSSIPVTCTILPPSMNLYYVGSGAWVGTSGSVSITLCCRAGNWTLCCDPGAVFKCIDKTTNEPYCTPSLGENPTSSSCSPFFLTYVNYLSADANCNGLTIIVSE